MHVVTCSRFVYMHAGVFRVLECAGVCGDCEEGDRWNGNSCEGVNECQEQPHSTFAHRCVNAECIDLTEGYRL